MKWLCTLIALTAALSLTPSRAAEAPQVSFLMGLDPFVAMPALRDHLEPPAPLIESRACLTRYAAFCGWLGVSAPGPHIGLGYFKKWSGGRWSTGLGIEYGSPDEIVSTSWSYAIYLERRLTRHVALGLKHRSNCATFLKGLNKHWCISWPLPRGTQPNAGYNFIYLKLESRWLK